MNGMQIQNNIHRFVVIVFVILFGLLGLLTAIYISDTASLRRDMLDYAQASIKTEYEKLRTDKEQSLKEGFNDLEQIEKLMDDYKNNSLEMDELLQGMEAEIITIRGRS